MTEQELSDIERAFHQWRGGSEGLAHSCSQAGLALLAEVRRLQGENALLNRLRNGEYVEARDRMHRKDGELERLQSMYKEREQDYWRGVGRLRAAGDRMANICHNLAQSDSALPAHHVQVLVECRRVWDATGSLVRREQP
jgi:hypothetical protein